MRARLGEMVPGQQYSFICLPKMAEKIERVIKLAGGDVISWDERQYGVVISVRKQY